jgi:hypothetical protein
MFKQKVASAELIDAKPNNKDKAGSYERLSKFL